MPEYLLKYIDRIGPVKPRRITGQFGKMQGVSAAGDDPIRRSNRHPWEASMKHVLIASFVVALTLGAGTVQADSQKLRIISWADYVPADLVAAFKKETGIDVELTLSNNEEMISKLRATGGAGYDVFVLSPALGNYGAGANVDGSYTIGLPAGTYTLFTLPSKDQWIFIVSKKTGEWGIPYPEGEDLGRTPMTGKTLSAPQENMSISFENTKGDSTELHVKWGTTDQYVTVKAQ